MKHLILTVAATFALAACADSVPVEKFEADHSVAEVPVNTGAPSAPGDAGQSEAQAAQNEVARGAAALALQPVGREDFENRIESGLGCSFASAGEETLLVASAPDDSTVKGQAVIKLGGKATLLDTDRPGGYNYLREGAAFIGKNGLIVSIVRDQGEGKRAGAESTVWPATLIIMSDDGDEQQYPRGKYSCGA